MYMKYATHTTCVFMQELVDKARSTLRSAAAALLTGSQADPQPEANGIGHGMPQHQHAGITAVAMALTELQQLDSASSLADSAAGMMHHVMSIAACQQLQLPAWCPKLHLGTLCDIGNSAATVLSLGLS
jgi:hypothetical protein